MCSLSCNALQRSESQRQAATCALQRNLELWAEAAADLTRLWGALVKDAGGGGSQNGGTAPAANGADEVARYDEAYVSGGLSRLGRWHGWNPAEHISKPHPVELVAAPVGRCTWRNRVPRFPHNPAELNSITCTVAGWLFNEQACGTLAAAITGGASADGKLKGGP
jgi:hypothetical protein